MDESEQRVAGFRLQPLASRTEYSLSRALDIGRLLLGIRTEMKWAVINVESLSQTEACVQNITTDESCRAIAICLKHFCDSDEATADPLAVFFDAVNKWVSRAQQGSMGRES